MAKTTKGTKKAETKTAASAKVARKTPARAPTKTEILAGIAEATGLKKKDVQLVLDALTSEIEKALSQGAGVFAIPGLIKIEKKEVPARPARKGVRIPSTGEIRDIPAKPASVKVKVRPLKLLKSFAE